MNSTAMKRVAIIGAGISGITIAKELSQKVEVTIFEKARGVGGRMSTRYADPFCFDHGTQFFTARSQKFHKYLNPYMHAGVASEWKGRIIRLDINKQETDAMVKEKLLVASPNMNSLCKYMAKGIDIRTSCEVTPLSDKDKRKWLLRNTNGENLGLFDWVISTAPPPQTIRLFSQYIKENSSLCTATMQGCYALIIGFKRPWDRTWIAAMVQDNPINWIAVNSSKPGRDKNVTCFVVHSTNDWAQLHINDHMEQVEKFLMEQFTALTGIDTKHAEYLSTHRWLYAKTKKSYLSSFYIDRELGIAAVGDWCGHSRIEDAWMHAIKLGEYLLNELG